MPNTFAPFCIQFVLMLCLMMQHLSFNLQKKVKHSTYKICGRGKKGSYDNQSYAVKDVQNKFKYLFMLC